MDKSVYKSILFFVNTYMQLITAIQIRVYLFGKAEADIILTDCSQNMEHISQRLKNLQLFRKILFIKTRYVMSEQSFMKDIGDVIRWMSGNYNKYREILGNEESVYYAIFYYSPDIFFYIACDNSAKNGIEPKCFRYEEGILSYPEMKQFSPPGRRLQLFRLLRLLHGQPDFLCDTENFFCYYPELFGDNPRQICHGIPFLRKGDREMQRIWDAVFGYMPKVCRQKYIYFSTSWDIDGKRIEEHRLVEMISKMVGRENLIVKAHPRDGRGIYEKMGLEVWKESFLPWEIIQLNQDFHDKVFLSLSSGSVLNACAMLHENIETFYLFPYIKGKNKKIDAYCKELEKSLKSLQKMGYCENHRITGQMESIKRVK